MNEAFICGVTQDTAALDPILLIVVGLFDWVARRVVIKSDETIPVGTLLMMKMKGNAVW